MESDLRISFRRHGIFPGCTQIRKLEEECVDYIILHYLGLQRGIRGSAVLNRTAAIGISTSSTQSRSLLVLPLRIASMHPSASCTRASQPLPQTYLDTHLISNPKASTQVSSACRNPYLCVQRVSSMCPAPPPQTTPMAYSCDYPPSTSRLEPKNSPPASTDPGST